MAFVIPGDPLTVQPARGGVFGLQRGGRRVAADIRKAPELVLGSRVHLLVWRKTNDSDPSAF